MTAHPIRKSIIRIISIIVLYVAEAKDDVPQGRPLAASRGQLPGQLPAEIIEL